LISYSYISIQLSAAVQIPEIINLRRGKAHSFGGFSPGLVGTVAFRQHIIAEASVEEAVHPRVAGKQREKEKGAGVPSNLISSH
jgi:hypothetical protein